MWPAGIGEGTGRECFRAGLRGGGGSSIASASERSSGNTIASVFIMPPAVPSSYSRSSFTSDNSSGSISSRIPALVSSEFGKSRGGFVGRHFLDDIGGDLRARELRGCWLASWIDFGKALRRRLRCRWCHDRLALGGAEFFRRCPRDRPGAGAPAFRSRCSGAGGAAGPASTMFAGTPSGSSWVNGLLNTADPARPDQPLSKRSRMERTPRRLRAS